MSHWISIFWPLLLSGVSLTASVAATIHAVLWKRDSRSVIGWVGLIWLAPIVGSIAYACFGINRIQRKALSLQVSEAWVHRNEYPLSEAQSERRDQLVKAYPNLISLSRLGNRLSGLTLYPGNRVEPLINGDEAYPAMLSAIEGAQESVALLSYIFDSDRAGERFLEALLAAQKRGVEVRVLIDHVGSRYSRPSMIDRLRKAGLKVAAFLPTRVPRMFKYSNLRNHRKILVVDGRIGFTGGTNIREGHWFTLDPREPVQCVHFRIQGPSVAHLQKAFMLDWAFASGESLKGPLWFPDIESDGPVWVRGIPDGPDEDFETLLDLMVGALAAATRQVSIVTPYFLPQATLIHALNVTAMRGVEVRIALPSRNNIPMVHWAATAQHWQFLEKGCRIFLTPPPFDHTKLMVVDGVWSLIGSTNWDPRSLRLNFEYNMECYDDAMATRLEGIIEEKIRPAHEITLEEVNERPFPVRLRDGLARLATPYL